MTVSYYHDNAFMLSWQRYHITTATLPCYHDNVSKKNKPIIAFIVCNYFVQIFIYCTEAGAWNGETASNTLYFELKWVLLYISVSPIKKSRYFGGDHYLIISCAQSGQSHDIFLVLTIVGLTLFPLRWTNTMI
jgi:hypothetical protein